MKKDKSKCAEAFRKKYPNYSFTQVGYSVCPKDVEKKYLELVDIETGDCIRGVTEDHKCKECGKIVYSRIHT